MRNLSHQPDLTSGVQEANAVTRRGNKQFLNKMRGNIRLALLAAVSLASMGFAGTSLYLQAQRDPHYMEMADEKITEAKLQWGKASNPRLSLEERRQAFNDAIHSLKTYHRNVAWSKVNFAIGGPMDADLPKYNDFTIEQLLTGTGITYNEYAEVHEAVRGGELTTYSSDGGSGMEYAQTESEDGVPDVNTEASIHLSPQDQNVASRD